MKLSQILACLIVMLGLIDLAYSSPIYIPIPTPKLKPKPTFLPPDCDGSYKRCVHSCPRFHFELCSNTCKNFKDACEKRRIPHLYLVA